MLANKLGHKQLKMEGLSIAIVAYIPQFQCALCWHCAVRQVCSPSRMTSSFNCAVVKYGRLKNSNLIGQLMGES